MQLFLNFCSCPVMLACVVSTVDRCQQLQHVLISNTVVCYYAEKWKCSDWNVLEFDKSWTSQIPKTSLICLIFISSARYVDAQSALKCTCGASCACVLQIERYICNRPSWNDGCTFKRRCINFSFSLFHALICRMFYCWGRSDRSQNSFRSKIDNGCMLSTNTYIF